MTTSFDVVVVGAGPAGSAAALVLARGGARVALLERGPFPGSKNMYGGVVYGRVLDALIPRWWETVPVQRWITRRSTMVLTDRQSLSLDFRSQNWGDAPYNGCTTFRPDFDSWLAAHAESSGAVLVNATTVTGLIRTASGRVCGVTTDRPDGGIDAQLVIACDGVNSFLAKEAGLYKGVRSEHFTLGVKEVLGLSRSSIDERFGLSGDDGADFEILGGTRDIPGGAFLYTNAESISVGVVVALCELAASQWRPEDLLASVKAHPAIEPFVRGGELKEYSAHLIPEGGYDAMPELATDGMLVAGDAAGLCLAAGLWLEGVNFAIGSGAAAGEVALAALKKGDVTAASLSDYRRLLESNFVLQDHKKLRRAPKLVLSHRMQAAYPQLACDVVEQLFTVNNPVSKPGALRALRQQISRHNLRARDLVKDAWTAARTFG